MFTWLQDHLNEFTLFLVLIYDTGRSMNIRESIEVLKYRDNFNRESGYSLHPKGKTVVNLQWSDRTVKKLQWMFRIWCGSHTELLCSNCSWESITEDVTYYVELSSYFNRTISTQESSNNNGGNVKKITYSQKYHHYNSEDVSYPNKIPSV